MGDGVQIGRGLRGFGRSVAGNGGYGGGFSSQGKFRQESVAHYPGCVRSAGDFEEENLAPENKPKE